MIPVDMLKQFFSQNVPFAKHAGIRLEDISEGTGVAVLPDLAETKNHVGTQHAGALFTLGEVASGGAAVSAVFPVLMSSNAIITSAEIRYTGKAMGEITATGKLGMDTAALMSKLNADGKIEFPVEVAMVNSDGKTVCTMTVQWRVALHKKPD